MNTACTSERNLAEFTCTSERNLAEFVSKSGRKVRHTLPDGNSLFRSLSVNLYNHEEENLASFCPI